MWKTIPAIGALWLASRARMLADNRPSLRMTVVPTILLHKCSHQAPHPGEVYAGVLTANIENIHKDLAEAQSAGLLLSPTDWQGARLHCDIAPWALLGQLLW